MLKLLLLVISVIASSQADKQIPQDFLIGAGTSAFQIEGAWNEDGKGESIWDTFLHDKNAQEKGDIACDSYHKWEEDVANAKALGLDFYRFSIAWTRILPNGTLNNINQQGIDYYLNLIKALKAEGIEPMITIYHWDMPQHIYELGGLLNTQFYTKIMLHMLNIGLHLIGDGIYQCGYVLLQAHARAYRIYEEEFKPLYHGHVGLVINFDWAEAATDSSADLEAQERYIEFEALKAEGIEPMITIYHWDMPQHIYELGGLLNTQFYTKIMLHMLNIGLHLIGDGIYQCGYVLLQAHARAYRIYEEEFKPLYHELRSSQADKQIPQDFLIGAGTSAFQIEGAWNEDGKGESIWDTFLHDKNAQEKGDIACDSYHKWEEDVANAKALGLDFYRFSIAWTRILPNGTLNNINQQGIDYYLNLIKALKAEGIEPMITIYHWDMPQHIYELGGLHLIGDGIYQCGYVLLQAHARAYRIYEEEFKPLYHVGQVEDEPEPEIGEPSYVSDEAVRSVRSNEFYYPEGLRTSVNYINQKYQPRGIIITENGKGIRQGDSLDDQERINTIRDFMSALVDAAVEDGVNVIGYSVWSLIDNFEWGSYE
ncbi:hypothetical protein HUJ04_010285 [Dendroctonus ponderosae]|nr:hypothetical protein HUJ04_010285 [Dendroctonus ponderosae]